MPVGPLATTRGQQLTGVTIFPVPAARGSFTVDMGSRQVAEATSVVVFNVRGQVVYHQAFGMQQAKLAVEAALKPGIYQVRVRRGDASFTQKVSVP
ncbi:MAG: T9SS type A sorting domain-containing protein [Hymenobacter sp.]|nr:T9SS type A sorting domain-containing protein [Hymenobacter sp.]